MADGVLLDRYSLRGVNLARIIDGHPADDVALIEGTTRLSYGALRQRVSSARGGLLALGVNVGDRVALLGDNSIDVVTAYLAVLGVGAVAVPLNPHGPPAAVLHEMETVGATLALTGAAIDAPAGVRAVPVPDMAGESTDIVDVDEGQLAVLMFTSGTAGASRAAQLSHGNLLANLRQNQAIAGSTSADDVVLSVLPLHHIFGLNVTLGLALMAGARVVLVDRFDADETLDIIRRERATVVPGAPPMWVAWSTHPDVTRSSFASVRLALTGAAKMPEGEARAFADRSGVALREGYGLTEAAPVITTSMIGEPRLGSIGHVLPGVSVRLVDEDGDDVPDGDPGEIWAKGPNIFGGYWNDPEATARVLVDGWLHTGDVAIVDDDGYLYLVDRAKDLIIVSGFNVFPTEVEDALATFAGVADVAVIGVPHPSTGESIKAFVVLDPGVPTPESRDLIDHCRQQLARYKCPSDVAFIDAIPKGPSGKILRRLLH